MVRAELELAIQRALIDDESFGVGCDNQDELEAAARFSATFIANAIEPAGATVTAQEVLEIVDDCFHVGTPQEDVYHACGILIEKFDVRRRT